MTRKGEEEGKRAGGREGGKKKRREDPLWTVRDSVFWAASERQTSDWSQWQWGDGIVLSLYRQASTIQSSETGEQIVDFIWKWKKS